MRRVFVIRDFESDGEIALEALKRTPPEGYDEVITPGLVGGKTQGQIFDDAVRGEMARATHALALVDSPNANVGFELGYALGLEKPVALARVGLPVPEWLAKPPLAGYLAPRAEGAQALREILEAAEDDWVRLERKPGPGDKVVFLCPEQGEGESLLQAQAEIHPDWITLPPSQWSLVDLAKQLDGVRKLVWTLAPFPPGTDKKDGGENAANAIVAGYAAARNIELCVLRHDRVRKIADLGHLEERFRQLRDFENLLRAIRNGEPDRSPAPGPDASPDHRPSFESEPAGARTERKPRTLFDDVREACDAFAEDVEGFKRKLGSTQSNDSIDAIFPEFKESADCLFERLGKAEREHSSTGAELQKAREEFRETAAALPFYEIEFNDAALKKRFNYAGDFEVIDMLLLRELDSSGFRRLYDAYLLQLPAVRAVVDRHHYISQRIAAEYSRAPRDRPFRIASIGCGPAREYLWLQPIIALDNAEVHLVDTSQEALDHAASLLSNYPSSTRFHYHHEDVLDYRREGLTDLTERFGAKLDVLYCLGVMDYLSDRLVARTLRIFSSSVVPDGVCLVGNFDPQNPTRAYMEWLLDWPLHYRTKEKLHEITAQACPGGGSLRTFDVGHGVNNIIELGGRRSLALPQTRREPTSPVDAGVRPETPQEGSRDDDESGRLSVEAHRQAVVRGLGFSCLLGGIMYPMWILLDAVLVRALRVYETGLEDPTVMGDWRLEECFFIRIAVMVYLLAFSFSTLAMRDRRPLARVIWFGSIGHLAMGFGLIWIMAILDAFGTNYHAGLIMVLIAISTMTPWRPIRTAGELLLIAIGYVVWAILDEGSPLPNQVIQNIVFVAGSAFILGLAAFLFPIYRRPRLPQAAVAQGRAKARVRIKPGWMRNALVRLAGWKAGVIELWRTNPIVIGIFIIVLCLCAILAILVWSAVSVRGEPTDGDGELMKLVLGSFFGVFSTVAGGAILMGLRRLIPQRDAAATRSDS